VFSTGPAVTQVSCIIPTRDRRDLVLLAVESVMAQEGGVPEIVVVDDGSLDGTREALLARHPGLHVVSSPGVGPGGARNAGVRAARGEYLMFLDSDDRWLPAHVEALLSAMRTGCQVAYGVTRNLDRFRGEEFLLPEGGEGVHGRCFRELARWCFLVPSSVCVTRGAFDAVGGFGPGDLGEDWVFFLRLSERFPFGFCPAVVTLRLLHGGSLCCLRGGRRRVRNAVGMVSDLVARSDGSGPEEIAWARSLRDFADKEEGAWETVQDLFLTLKSRGMLPERS